MKKKILYYKYVVTPTFTIPNIITINIESFFLHYKNVTVFTFYMDYNYNRYRNCSLVYNSAYTSLIIDAL